MKNKKPTLSIAIPALNEEKNIKFLIMSILKQKNLNFKLSKILIQTDGSTDKTVSIVKNLAKIYPIIKLQIGKHREGKYKRLNQFFRDTKSDILVVLDADIYVVGKNFLDSLSEILITDPNSMLVAAHQISLRPRGFIARAIYSNFLLWDYVRWGIPNFRSPSNYFGSATAYRGSFVRNLIIPDDLSDPHLYIYLSADKINGFRYCKDAIINDITISTMSDFNKFLNRSIGKHDPQLIKIFGKNIKKAQFIHWKYKVRGMVSLLRNEPLYALPALLLVQYAKLYIRTHIDKNSVWEVVASTKKSFTNENR